MTSVWIICMESDDPICVHFVFKCKIINNAQILGELSYMLLLVVFIWHLIPMTCLFGRQTFLVLVLCAIMRSVEGFVHSLMIFSSFGILLSFDIVSKWYLKSCVDLGVRYNLDNSLSCHTWVWFLDLIGILSKLYLVWFLKVLCMHIYYMYILWHAYFRWSNI